MQKGTVKKWFEDKGYGFITPEDGGKDLFFHFSAWHTDTRQDPPQEGQEVEFDTESSDRGPKAVKVRPVGMESSEAASDEAANEEEDMAEAA